jgi:hypothetical protein
MICMVVLCTAWLTIAAAVLAVKLDVVLLQVWPLKLPPAGWAFPQRRMQHFIKVLGAACAIFVQVRTGSCFADGSAVTGKIAVAGTCCHVAALRADAAADGECAVMTLTCLHTPA